MSPAPARLAMALRLCLPSVCTGTLGCGPADSPVASATPEDGPGAATGPRAAGAPGAPDLEPLLRDPAAAAQGRAEGRQHRQQGRTREARTALLRAWRQQPDHREGALELADLLLSNVLEADPDLALLVLERTFGAAPEDLAARRLMARGAYRALQPQRARRLAEALALDPAAPPPLRGEARFLLGAVAEDAGDFHTAAEEYRRALQERPDRALYACRLGIALEETGAPEEAERRLRQAIRLEPGLVEAHFRLAGLLRRLGREEEADQQGRIHRALNRASDSMARTQAALEERIEALSELEHLYPDYVQGRLQLCELRLVQERPDEAAAVARRLIEARPDVTRAYALWIEATRRDRGDEATRAALRDLLRDTPGMPAAVRQQAMTLVLKGFQQ